MLGSSAFSGNAAAAAGVLAALLHHTTLLYRMDTQAALRARPPTSSLQDFAGNGHGGVDRVGDDLNDSLQTVTTAADAAAAGVRVKHRRLAGVAASQGGVCSWLSQEQTADPPPDSSPC